MFFRRVIDTENSIISIHHFDSRVPLIDAQAAFRNIMLKRFQRLHDTIIASRSIGMICNRNDSVEELTDFLHSFSEIYPLQHFTLINIRNNDSEVDLSSNIYHISERLTLLEYEFQDNGSNNNYKWRGNELMWGRLLSNITVQTPYLKSLRELGKNYKLLIYGVGKYARECIAFLQKLHISIFGIAVSSLKDNPAFIDDIPVYDIEHYKEYSTISAVIIAMADLEQSQIIYEKLLALGFQNILKFDLEKRITSFIDT